MPPRIRWFVFALSIALVSACAPEPSWHDPNDTTKISFSSDLRSYERAMLVGELGDIPEADGARVIVAGAAGGSSRVRIDLDDPATGSWRMVEITFPSPLERETLVVGTELDSSVVSESESVHVLGCSGEFHGALDWDHEADRTVVRVEAGGQSNRRIVRFYASFGSQAVEGAFEVGL
jgi:hypothetical protein